MSQNLPTSQTRPASVLILDDDVDALEEIFDILDLDGFQAHCVSTVSEAERMLIDNPQITSVVTDVHLSRSGERGTNGIDFISRMRKRIRDREISYIVQSGDPSAIVGSIEQGAVDFLTKPLVPEDLLRAVRKRSTDQDQSSVADLLLRKVQETTESLQQANIELAERDEALFASREEQERHRQLKHKIRRALANGAIRPWFQPKVCLYTGRILGFEALVRWIDPIGGMQSPAEFLPAAIEVGMMSELDATVQRHALDGLRVFQTHGVCDCKVGINLTAGQLCSTDLVDSLLNETARANLSPKDVSVEVLETAMLDDDNGALIKDNIQCMAENGFAIELDDFGTGHAGLSSLRDISVSQIKIDRSFVQDVHKNTRLQSFTNALISLAKSLNVGVLAEGVECAEEMDWLKQAGCDAVQGFYLARPMPHDEAVKWANRWDHGGMSANLRH